ncbi:hypothetical protein H5410_015877 [Solanum commersonii]|uniref:Uncharacterized protein n=1 Tax=Solanum commersonii TaxID=4109 RepID=A0A9J5ZUP9_SOLCO|nr:hypothetical protein H5410_015877 [Solanum commersonii]
MVETGNTKVKYENFLNRVTSCDHYPNLWKNRCAAKYGAKQSNTRVKFLILKDTTHLLNTAFPYIQWANEWVIYLRMVEKCKSRKIGGGNLERPSGRMIYAFAIPLGTGTNNQAEVQALAMVSYGASNMDIRKFTRSLLRNGH